MKKLFIINITFIFLFCVILIAQTLSDEKVKWKICYADFKECKELCRETFPKSYNERVKCRKKCKEEFRDCTNEGNDDFVKE